MSVENHGRMILTGENRSTWRKTCPSATLSTTNYTWIDLGVNPGLCVERLATNCLSHSMAMCTILTKTSYLALFSDVITVCSENHTKPMKKLENIKRVSEY
jgi:hypothetical protein